MFCMRRGKTTSLLCLVLLPWSISHASECQTSHGPAGAVLIQHRRGVTIKSEKTSLNASEANISLTHAGWKQKTDGEEIAGISDLAMRLPSTGVCRKHPCALLSVDEGEMRGRGLGKTANLNEYGYSNVAKLKDDNEMKDFIERVIEKFDCKIEDEGGLMGFVPWFSGTVATQSILKLEEALLFAILSDGTPWLSFKNSAGVTGDNVKLDLEGYVTVACTRNDAEMKNFARRMVGSLNVKIRDEGGFSGMVEYFSGSATFQSFDSLQEEIQAAARAPNSWAEFDDEKDHIH